MTTTAGAQNDGAPREPESNPALQPPRTTSDLIEKDHRAATRANNSQAATYWELFR